MASDSSDPIGNLSEMTLFSQLGSTQLERVRALATVKAFSPGALLCEEGRENPGLFVVLSGKVKLFQTGSSGKGFTVDLLARGGAIGLSAAICSSPAICSAKAVGDVQALVLSSESLQSLLQLPELTYGAMRYLAEVERRRAVVIAKILNQDVYARVAFALVRLFAKDGWTQLGDENLSLRVRREDLADVAGTTLESAVRSLARLKIEGVVEVWRREVRLRAREALFRISGIEN